MGRVSEANAAGVTLAAGARARAELGPWLVAFTGWVLVGSGLFALALAATVNLLPHDGAYLGMTHAELCTRHSCRVARFMAHDRVAFGGSIIAIGILYHWLARGPLRRGRAWAWWALCLSGLVGFGSFLTYLGYGYLDLWHGRATLALLPFFAAGLLLSRRELEGANTFAPGSDRSRARGPAALLVPGERAPLRSRLGAGRACLLFTAVGMMLGGLIILTVGLTHVFVPQDLEFMGVRADDLRAISPRLVPLIANDRSGFGGGLFSGGIAKGLTDEMLAWQTRRFQELALGTDGWTVHLRPELVVEVAFGDVQESPHYPGGMALRFARVKRYREDKTAAEADTVDTVRAILAAGHTRPAGA